MRRPSVSLLAAAAFVLATAVSSRADDLDLGATLDGIKTAVAERHYGRALADLQVVLTEVSRLRADGLKTRLPAAPQGWTAEDAEAQDMSALAAMGGGTIVRRRYVKGEANVTLELMVGGGLWYAPLQAMLSNPMFAGAGMKQVTVKGRRGLLELDAADKRATLQLLLNVPNAVLKVEGQGVTRDDVEKTFGGAFDFDAAEKAAAD